MYLPAEIRVNFFLRYKSSFTAERENGYSNLRGAHSGAKLRRFSMKLMVIDGNSIINRAFYGIRMLTTRDGTPTNAVYGFLNILAKLYREDNPDALCVTFDLKAPTFRHEKYEGYKAQRKAMPDELAVQLPILKEVLEAMNIPRYELPGWEADDLIGTISVKCADAGWECVAVTGDKDSFQLITATTSVKHIKTRMGQTETTLYTPEKFAEEYGFSPIEIIDLKALMGDSSDNIPGVSGIGEKTATDLVRRFGSIEEIYKNINSPEIKESVRKKLLAGKADAEMSYDLATIRCDAPIEFSPEGNRVQPVNNDALYKLFKKLEFTKLTDKFSLTPPKDGDEDIEETFSLPDFTLCPVTDEETVLQMLSAVKGGAVISFDPHEMLAVIAAEGTAFALSQDSTPDFTGVLGHFFATCPDISGHNAKEICRFAAENSLCIPAPAFDTALAAYLLSPTDSAYPIDKLGEQYLGLTSKESDESGQQLSLDDIADPYRELRRSAGIISALIPVLREKLEQNGLLRVLTDIELPLCPVLGDMEAAGFLVDKNALEQFSALLAQGIEALENEIYALCGMEFNINSPKQLGAVLFDGLMLPAPKKTKTGYSTSADVLEKLAGKHPVIPLILKYRQLTKLKSTYADGLAGVIASDGRIHTNFQMTVTATGRLSSTEPNLQNIPVRTELGGEIRKMFVAKPGYVLVDADYSQIELRLLAHISGDEVMQKAFLSGEDIHAVTASQVFGVPLNEVTKLQRSHAKAVNFGIVYGISPFSLSQDIGVTVAEAKLYMDMYLAKYHGVRDYMKNIVEQAKKDGYVSTLYGRRRYLPELKSSNYNVRSFGERVALNMPIQGTAADIMKLAMIRVYNALKNELPEAALLLQVHDELIVECPQDLGEKAAAILLREMEGTASLSVPLTADANIGKSWYDAK